MPVRLPEWIRTGAPTGLQKTIKLLRRHRLATVCEEARCPNRGTCFSRPTAAFMILGSRCTRDCSFCSVSHGLPLPVDISEPDNVAAAAEEMGLKYVVITSVTRDDLPDGGAAQFARVVTSIRGRIPGVKIEVLTPDFGGDMESLRMVLDSGPDVFNHNVETVPRLYSEVRPEADYGRSLNLINMAKDLSKGIFTKSGFMLGLGETREEVLDLLGDLRKVRCDFVTIGQYLRPTRENLAVVEYIRPEVFKDLKAVALDMGFKNVASGPLVRSSMNAEEMLSIV